MKIVFFALIFLIDSNFNTVHSANWCKVIYNQNISEGEIKENLDKCKNSDNIFIAIHSSFQNAGHLLNSMIAENCDIRRNVLSTQPRSGDPYFTAVCEFRRHLLR
tara:strand:+ start:589 stop:903 length:315 start_codon:yes stop_codon:yes gene_type:complete